MTSRGQTVVPAKIRKDYRMKPNMQLEWIDDGQTIRVVPIPKDSIRAARGMTKGLYKRLLDDWVMERQRE
jgi:bifunctional DNA-binding transcriptional regulator/antitoxin component of YhaV-PrlF toxin-antitoxin module